MCKLLSLCHHTHPVHPFITFHTPLYHPHTPHHSIYFIFSVSSSPALENHPPLAVAEFLDRLNVMKMNDNQLFLEEFGAIPMTLPHPCEASEMLANKDKNRFNDISSYDYNRVKLQDGLNTDYINASHCDVSNSHDGHL